MRCLLANIIKNTGFGESNVTYRWTIRTCYRLVYYESLSYAPLCCGYTGQVWKEALEFRHLIFWPVS